MKIGGVQWKNGYFQLQVQLESWMRQYWGGPEADRGLRHVDIGLKSFWAEGITLMSVVIGQKKRDEPILALEKWDNRNTSTGLLIT